MLWFLRLFPQHRRLEERARRSLERERFTHQAMLRMADLAYDRRTALQDIAKCETPNCNATVRRMAKIASDALKDAENDASILSGDTTASFVRHHVITMQGGGGGASKKPVWTGDNGAVGEGHGGDADYRGGIV